jgi:hypothetical protein
MLWPGMSITIRESMNLHQLRFVREAVRQNYNLTEVDPDFETVI